MANPALLIYAPYEPRDYDYCPYITLQELQYGTSRRPYVGNQFSSYGGPGYHDCHAGIRFLWKADAAVAAIPLASRLIQPLRDSTANHSVTSALGHAYLGHEVSSVLVIK